MGLQSLLYIATCDILNENHNCLMVNSREQALKLSFRRLIFSVRYGGKVHIGQRNLLQNAREMGGLFNIISVSCFIKKQTKTTINSGASTIF